MTTVDGAREFLRKNAGKTGIEILVNFVLPFVLYDVARGRYGDVDALLASMVPPLLWSIVEFARNRRIDGISVFILLGIALSLLAFVGGGSVKFLQLRETLVGGVVALVFLGSAAIGKPLIYELAVAGARRRSQAQAASLEQLKGNAGFRRSMMVMTVVWGVGLLVHTAVNVVLVFQISIAAFLIVSPIVGYGTIGALSVWTYWYSKRQQRIGAARRAAAERATT